MEVSFRDFLCKEGIKENTLIVLEEEQINTKEVFCLLQSDHFEKLLTKMTLRQHAKLIKIWKNCSTTLDYISCPKSISLYYYYYSYYIMFAVKQMTDSTSSRSRSSSPHYDDDDHDRSNKKLLSSSDL